ncbi:MAG: hypothetical protein OEM22_01585 [Acidimicrobiia bacterium]|nr:hypothetical protein [Acidimicrobiia bacterium]
MSESLRKSLTAALVAIYLAIAPSEVPWWRTDPENRPTAVLVLGGPGLYLFPHR